MISRCFSVLFNIFLIVVHWCQQQQYEAQTASKIANTNVYSYYDNALEASSYHKEFIQCATIITTWINNTTSA